MSRRIPTDKVGEMHVRFQVGGTKRKPELLEHREQLVKR